MGAGYPGPIRGTLHVDFHIPSPLIMLRFQAPRGLAVLGPAGGHCVPRNSLRIHDFRANCRKMLVLLHAFLVSIERALVKNLSLSSPIRGDRPARR